MGSETQDPVRLLVYGDFNCPFSALASARAADLEQRGLAEIDWRGVEHDPAIPLAGEIIVESRRNVYERELADIRDLLVAGEPDRLQLPPTRSNTRIATETYAAAPPHERPCLRERLFSAYWGDGSDLTDAGVVAILGGSGRDERHAGEWHDEWMALPRPIVPVMVLADGYVSRGLGALARLAQLMSGLIEAGDG